MNAAGFSSFRRRRAAETAVAVRAVLLLLSLRHFNCLEKGLESGGSRRRRRRRRRRR